MKHYGLTLPEGSEITNLTVPVGTSDPSNPNVGELFFRSDTDQFRVYTGSAWFVVESSSNGPTLTINSEETGTPVDDCFIVVERGTGTNVAIKWNETSDSWQLTNDGTTYYDIIVGSNGAFIDEITVAGNNPKMYLQDLDAGTDEEYWLFDVNGGSLYGRVTYDNQVASSNWLKVDRTGGTVDLIELSSTVAVIHNGTAGQAYSYDTRTAAVVDSGDAAGTTLSIIAPATGYSGIFFGDNSSETTGQFRYDHTDDTFKVYAVDGDKFTISSSGAQTWSGTALEDVIHTGGGQTIGGNLTVSGMVTVGGIQTTNSISGTTNVDTLSDGLYRFAGQSALTGDVPLGHDYGILWQINDSAQPTQLYFGGTNVEIPSLAVRRKDGGVWQPWTELIHDKGGQVIGGSLTINSIGSKGLFIECTQPVISLKDTSVSGNSADYLILRSVENQTDGDYEFVVNNDITSAADRISLKIFGEGNVQVASAQNGYTLKDVMHTGGGQIIDGSLHASTFNTNGTAIFHTISDVGGLNIYPGNTYGGWARGVRVLKQSDSSIIGGAGFLGNNESMTAYGIGFGPVWYTTGDARLLVNASSGKTSVWNGSGLSEVVHVGGGQTIGGTLDLTGNIEITNTLPGIIFEDSDAAANEKRWKFQVVPAGFTIQGLTDAGSGGGDFIQITRTSNSIDALEFYTSGVLKSYVHTDGSASFTALSATSLDITDYVKVQDNDSIYIGSSNDLRIYHDGGSVSYIDNGVNTLFYDTASSHQFGINGTAELILDASTLYPATNFGQNLGGPSNYFNNIYGNKLYLGSGNALYEPTQMAINIGGGSVALTTNDGHGNANITFNHRSGIPDQAGSSCRIETSVDGTTGAFYFEIGDDVASGVSTGLSNAYSMLRATHIWYINGSSTLNLTGSALYPSVNDSLYLGTSTNGFARGYFTESLFIEENSTAPSASAAGRGQLWVENTTPNRLMFTDDAGNDHDMLPIRGEYTPTITLSSGTYTLNASLDTLSYVKIGPLVHVQGRLQFTAFSAASATVSISLPYAIASRTDSGEVFTAPLTVLTHNNVNGSAGEPFIIYGSSGSQVDVYRLTNTGSPRILIGSDFNSTSALIFNFSYETDA